MIPVEILIDLRTCGLTFDKMLLEIERLQKERPDMEIYMDGDVFAIVGKKRIGGDQ